jgi:acetyl-CoA carboxylase biotin carboxyl carrier protein
VRLDVVPAVQMPAAAHQQAAAQDQDMGRYVKVESPIVGTFYRRPSPDAESFVKEGDIVSKGATLCIIEAMKLMNEIEAPTSGRVVKILGSDGQVVEFGEVLFLIDPSV